MPARALSVLFATAVGFTFGQAPPPVKAGDPAPNLTWSKIVASAPTSAGPQSLLGQTTVLLFLRLVSYNQETASAWNKLVEEFADRPVNFVWIANEPEESPAPFLKTHPVSGWLVLDPAEESYKSYGVEGGGSVRIDPHGAIIGFTPWTPDRKQIQAVLDGRAIAIRGEPTEEQKDELFEGKAVRLEVEPSRLPPAPQKPDLPPSEEVHISPSQTEGAIRSTGPDHWMRRGFDPRAILFEILKTTPARIELPAALDDGKRYDFALLPPREEDEETMRRQVREGIEKYFHVTITPAIRPVDVYVMTAVEGKTPPKQSEGEAVGGGSIASSTSIALFTKELTFEIPEGAAPTRKAVEEALRRAMDSPELREAMATAPLTAATASNSSRVEFRRALEDGLHRPVLDETQWTGNDDFQTRGEAQNTEQFLGMLRDQLGLVLTPTQRSIEITAVRLVE